MNIIMTFATGVFFILFAFLLSITLVFVLSLFRTKTYLAYAPALSIIIPTYNEEKHVAACIEHILAAPYAGEKEIIIVDDGSSDHTVAIAETYPVRIVLGAHEGKSAALNVGIAQAKHEILLTLDCDTFIAKECLSKIVLPLQEADVGATSGSCTVHNPNSILTSFQAIEYHYNNLIRHSFSHLFNTGIWFFGAMAAYKKSSLIEIGGFHKDTLAEDTDTALLLHQKGYRTVNVYDALGSTAAPRTMRQLYRQRKRWWIGVLQSLRKNKSLFHHKSSPSLLFLFINQYWWTLYAFLSFPLIVYQVYFWYPEVGGALYLLRWFSLAGPFYVLYMIPVWGLNWYNIFGVLSGIISMMLMLISVRLFGDTYKLRYLFALCFYFPYTILLNIFICISLFDKKETHFVK